MLAYFTLPQTTMTQDDPLQWRQLKFTALKEERPYGMRRQANTGTGRKFEAIAVE